MAAPTVTAVATPVGALLARKGDARPAMPRELPDISAFGPPAVDDLARHGRRTIAFTLRLDATRHARLRGQAAQNGQSAQKWLISTLDALFDRHAEAAPIMKGLS